MEFAHDTEVASDAVPGWTLRRGPRTIILVDPDGTEAGRTQQSAATLAALSARRLQGGPPSWPGQVVDASRRGSAVTVVASAVGVTPRQLSRWSQTRFGYGPKTLQRMLRMRRTPPLLSAAPT